MRAGCLRHRAGALVRRRHPAPPRRLAHDGGPQPRPRPAAPGAGRRREGARGCAAPGRSRRGRPTGRRRRRRRRRGRGRWRGRGGPRRSSAPHLHVLPSGPGLRGPDRAHPAHAGRHDDRRDRPCLPRSRGDHGPTARPGQAQDPQRRHPLRRPAGPPVARTHGGRARRASTCSSTRATRPARAATWCGGRSATRPSGSAARCAPSCPTSPRRSGLLALMLFHDARRAARVDAEGDLVLLDEQDRTLYDAGEIAEGRARLAAAARQARTGPFQVQAAIAVLSRRRRRDGLGPGGPALRRPRGPGALRGRRRSTGPSPSR